MEKSQEINEIGLALSLAQGEIENATKNATNPYLESKYADLASVLSEIRPVFSKHGLSILQAPSFNGERPVVTTIIIHKSGQWISSELSCLSGKNDAQGIGSAITYLRRYSLAAFAGIGQEDDDAESVKTDKKVEPKKEPAKAKKVITPNQVEKSFDGIWKKAVEETVFDKIKLSIADYPIEKIQSAKKTGFSKLRNMQGLTVKETEELIKLFEERLESTVIDHVAD